jgi:hypothetical protein
LIAQRFTTDEVGDFVSTREGWTGIRDEMMLQNRILKSVITVAQSNFLDGTMLKY